MISQKDNGIVGSFNLWWWGNVSVMCCVSITFPVYLIITNMSVSQDLGFYVPNTTHSQYSFLGITFQNCSPRGGKTTISLSGNHSSVKFNFNPFISLKNPFKLSIHEMWSIISNISNNSRIKRMLPFKSSTLYKVEPRRDFVVRPKQVKHSRGSHVQKMNQFYDIEQNVPLV